MSNDVKEEYAIYLRKSRSDIELEKNNSKLDTLLRHEKILKNLAISNNFNIAKIFREVVSGETIKERTEMQQLIKDVKDRKYKGVLVVELSRLTRGDKIDQGKINKIFKYSNTLVITPEKVYDLSNEKDEESFDDELTSSGKELKTIKKRLNRGRTSSVLEGKFVGNIAPYGFQRVKIQDDKGFILEELHQESDIVKKIFNLFVFDDFSINKIANELDKINIKPRKSNKWSVSTIKDILRNPACIGCIRWNHRPEVKYLDSNDENNICVSRPRNINPLIVEGIHKGFISQEIWDLAQEKLKKNKAPVPHNNIIKNPLSHILICQKCGSYMQRRPYKKTGQITSIQCTNKECNNISSKLYIVEEKIVKGLRYWLENYKISETPIKNQKTLDNITCYKDYIKQLNKNIQAENNRLKKVCQNFEDGVYDRDLYENRFKDIQSTITNLKKQINDYEKQLELEQKLLNEKENVIPKLENILDIYDKLETAEEKNRLLKTVVDKVTYLKTKKTLKKTDDPTDFEIHIFPKIGK